MFRALVRAAMAAILFATFLTPKSAFAADLTPAQAASITASTNTYFRALGRGQVRTLATLTTPDFTVVGPSGKVYTMSQISRRIANVRLETGGITHQLKLGPTSISGNTITEAATISIQGDMLTGGDFASESYQRTTKHTLTWVSDSSGAWLLSKDEVLSLVK
jgi:ketosteroid isomerase-like protein